VRVVKLVLRRTLHSPPDHHAKRHTWPSRVSPSRLVIQHAVLASQLGTIAGTFDDDLMCSMNCGLLSSKPVLSSSATSGFEREIRGRECFQQVRESHRLVTMGACRTRADATAKHATLVAPLFAEVAVCTRWAFVHGRQTWRL
jgi:hypothetical protein